DGRHRFGGHHQGGAWSAARFAKEIRQGQAMKKILLTTVALSALGLMSPALAADLPIYGKAPAVATPAYDWSGFYVGVFGGYAWGNHNLNNAVGAGAPLPNFTNNYESEGGFGGGEIGGNWQSGNVVVGIEADAFGA